MKTVKNTFARRTIRALMWAGLLACAVAMGLNAQAQTNASNDPPREHWMRIFEENYSNPDKAMAKQERKTWSEEMSEAFTEEFLEAKLAIVTARNDEAEKRVKKMRILGNAARLLGDIATHWQKYGNRINTERLEIVKRFGSDEGNLLLRDEIMSKHVRDYMDGMDVTREFLASVQRWLKANHPDKEN